jgi:hypothetical protein
VKTALAFVGFILACGKVVAGDTAAAERIAALHESFRPATIVRTDVSAVGEKDDVVTLERLTITESMSRRALAKQIEDRWAREADEKFTWKKGGLLSSRDFWKFQADTGLWVTLGEKVTGVNPSRELFIKVELLRIKW